MHFTVWNTFFKDIFNHIWKIRWVRHVIFWFLTIFTFTFQGTQDLDINIFFTDWFWFKSKMLIPGIPAAYLISYWVIPKFIRQRKYVIAILLFIFISYIGCFIARGLVINSNKHPIEWLSGFGSFFNWEKILFGYYLVPFLTTVTNFLIVRFFITHLNSRRKKLQKEKERIHAELKMLKTQLNPRFLFGVLDHIYELAQTNSENTPHSIEQLSKVLDYVLYQCNDTYVPLCNEIELLKDYLELKKTQLKGILKLDFIQETDAETEIAPLLLLNIIENGFKIYELQKNDSIQCTLFLFLKKENFNFVIDFAPSPEKNNTQLITENIQKQLDLLYKDQYSFETKNDSSKLNFKLTIKGMKS